MSSDSESSEPPTKKVKSSSNEEETKTLEKNDNGEQFMSLSAKKRLTVRKYRGMVLIDIREFFEKDGKLMPTKKGISLTMDQYKALRENVLDGTIDEAIRIEGGEV